MAAAAVETPVDPAAVSGDQLSASISHWSTPQHAEHPQAAEILRQVEYYFSEENLPSDAHPLRFTGLEGTNPVSLSLILGFKKMRGFRPKTAVREVLRRSKVVEVVDNNHIRRRLPLSRRPTVTPRIDVNRHKNDLARAQPHLSKNMLKPTGFEPNATEGPMPPDQWEKELEKYSPDDSLITRLETAANSFNANRKMHQDTRAIFEKLMVLGGFACNSRMFQGGMNKKQMQQEGMDKEEIAQLTAYYGAIEQVSDAYYDEWENGKTPEWVVDFEAVAKAFLSTVFLSEFEWYDQKQVATACQVLRNFYNYLTVHPVCPEHNDQLLAARAVCDVAEKELPKLATVDQNLPGAFNSACSTLFGGTYADVHISKAANDSWAQGADNVGLDRDQAVTIFRAGLAAYGTEEQSNTNVLDSKCMGEERLGLEIVATELPTDGAKEVYDFISKREGLKDYVKPMGKLICKRWQIPFEQPIDLPKRLLKAKDKNEVFKFLVEAETLQFCVPGMKTEAVVKELDLGIKWIDCMEVMYPTFYTWLPNERVLDWKEPGPPTSWMKRQTARKMGLPDPEEGVDAVAGAERADYSEEEPD